VGIAVCLDTRQVRAAREAQQGRLAMEWMLLPLKRYAQFSGRSRRKEYWMYTLFIILAGIVLSIVDSILGLGGHAVLTSETSPSGAFYGGLVNRGLLSNLFTLATFIPGLAVAVRRLHDTNRSGWWFLLVFIPLIGAIVLLIWFCTAGTPGPNNYGNDPLSDTPEELARTFE
jgi:uncharacterized membrane protein YhaH (DUF805 family)